MRRWIALLTIALGAAAVPTLAQNPRGGSSVPPPATADSPTPADLLGLGDAGSRMTVPVSIGSSGPYQFIIDTGAERSVVSRELAGSLNLVAGHRVRVTTMAGQSELGTFMLSALRVSQITPDTLEAPAVAANVLGAPGMLGIDALKGHSVAIDFDKGTMEVRTSTKRRARWGPDDIVVKAKNLYGQLIVTDARYHGRRISVVIDTGSPITIGNLALLRRVRSDKSLGQVSLMAITGQWLRADYRMIDTLMIAGISFNSVPIAFADALPFKRFGLVDTPALMLGMDSLRLFRKVQIDFANREVRFTLPRGIIREEPYGRSF